MDMNIIKEIAEPADSRIVMLVMDGLGGVPMTPDGPTELEAANTPNLDALARRSSCGLHIPVARGITPGSGPSHLALFGYDPFKYQIGRGVLEALGIDFDLRDTDVAARGNFATVDENGVVTDRRAGRISSEKAAELVALLSQIKLPGGEVFVEPVREHRFLVVFRGQRLSDALTDSDPGRVGQRPEPVRATRPEAAATADLVNQFISEADRVLAGHYPANAVLFRGFAKHPKMPTMQQVFGLKPAAVAIYPMYRGLAKLVGMEALPSGNSLPEQITAVAANFQKYSFFFVHYKKTDTAGEDGDFQRKVRAIEEVDEAIPALVDLNPDVLIVTGDHSTPALLRGHSWHPVPILIHSRYVRPTGVEAFGERACLAGELGVFPAVDIMPMAMANALRLGKYGA
ncbi:MAG: 2,3-bisphosphoglycerate-independent phosphoglycerate mutase [Chloroflexota bacterium]